MINWSKGISAKYYASIVDPNTWRDISDISITGGSVKYTDSGVRVTADVECTSFDSEKEYWIRLYLVARQGGEIERVPLFTGIASVPDVTYHGNKATIKIQCYSALSIAEKIYLPLGWYASEGSNGADSIKDLLFDIVKVPVVIDSVSDDELPIISQSIIAESEETNLSMVDKILLAINWRLLIDGDGTIHIAPPSSSVSGSFDYRNNDIFEMDVSISNNWFDIPNVFRAVGSGVSSIAKDEDPNSPFSISNRGREIWANETDVVLTENEKIGEYANRRLKELQSVQKTLDYTRRFDPDVKISDHVQINYLGQGISGIYYVKSQTLTIGYGGRISEQAEGV